MRRTISFLSIIVLCSSCLVSTKKYNEIESRAEAYSVVVKNQSSEIEQLKGVNSGLSRQTMELEGDTLRLHRQINLMEERYNRIIDQGTVSAVVAKRKADEFHQKILRNNDKLLELNREVEKRREIINNLEVFLTSKISGMFKDNNAVIYQTKGGLNLEFADCKVLRDTASIDSVDKFIDIFVPYLQANREISVVVDSYAAKNDTLQTETEVWEFSLKKGALFANMLIEKGVDPKRVDVLSHGISYPYTTGFNDDCPLRTIVKFNVDASHIIEIFDNLVKYKF